MAKENGKKIDQSHLVLAYVSLAASYYGRAFDQAIGLMLNSYERTRTSNTKFLAALTRYFLGHHQAL